MEQICYGQTVLVDWVNMIHYCQAPSDIKPHSKTCVGVPTMTRFLRPDSSDILYQECLDDNM